MQHFPDGIVRYLRDIGFLSERLTLAHCIHARPDEIEMIAASGTRIVTNFSSNMHLRSGLAPIAAAHQCGCAIAVGVDGLALDEDDDVLREMRLVQMFHGGVGFKRTWTRQNSSASPSPTAARPPARRERARCRRALRPTSSRSISIASIATQIMPVDPIELLFARGNASLLRDVVVDGRTIVSEGRCLGVDLPAIDKELRGIYRANAGKLSGFQRAWPPLSTSLQNWFEAQLDRWQGLRIVCAGLHILLESAAPPAAGVRACQTVEIAPQQMYAGACHLVVSLAFNALGRILAYRARSDHEGSLILLRKVFYAFQ